MLQSLDRLSGHHGTPDRPQNMARLHLRYDVQMHDPSR